jgi:hypothetical protein
MDKLVRQPKWVNGVENRGSVSLISVKRRNGSNAGYRVPRKSLLDEAAEEKRNLSTAR